VKDGNGRTVSPAKGLVDGPKAKIVTLENTKESGDAGTYILSRDGGKNVYLVSPANKSYVKIDIDELAAQVGNFMNAAGSFVKLEFSDPEFKTVLDERGPQMFGMKTRHIKTETSYTVNATVFGRSNRTAVTRKDEIWLTKDLNDSGMKLWSQQREI